MESGCRDADAAVPAALPDDVLADILGRPLAHSLASSRCVCKAWRDLADERGLLQRIRHLLPHSVSGIFGNYVDHWRPHFFARPTSVAWPAIDGEFSYVLPEERRFVWHREADHCNGLVLYRNVHYGGEMYVINPVTQRWVCLPDFTGGVAWRCRAFLAFSPAVSRHYQVLVAPRELESEEEQRLDHYPLQDVPAPPAGETEWPPSRWTWQVFSSRSGQWRETVFVRKGEAAGIVADLRMDSFYSLNPRWRYAVYRQGALYVHCRGEYVSRLSLSPGEYSYQVIKSPIDRSECYKNVKSYLGGSEGEVYFVAIYRWRLRVWMLNDHKSQQHDLMAGSEWILKHDRVLRPNDWWRAVIDRRQIPFEGPWILDDRYNYREDSRNHDWCSDGEDDVICSNPDRDQEVDNEGDYILYPETFDFVGFHPYKEVIFLETLDIVVAYYLSTSKVQFLGKLKPADHEWNYRLYDSFVYTPCHDLCVIAGEHL